MTSSSDLGRRNVAKPRPGKLLRVVTLVSESGRYGGPSATAVQQALSAARAGWSVRLLAGLVKDDCIEKPATPGLRLNAVPVRRILFWPGFCSLMSGKFLWQGLRDLRWCDVVHVSLARELIPLSIATLAWLNRRPLILQPHGMISCDSRLLARVFDIPLRRLMIRAAAVLFLSDEELHRTTAWLGKAVSHPIVLGNGVALSMDGAEGESGPTKEEVLFLARLHPRKRVRDFIAAADYSRAHALPGRYVVIGPDGGDLSLVQALIEAGSAVTYQGTVPPLHVRQRVAKCALFVLSSEAEPWGNVLVTALALGRPVIVTESAALAPLIRMYGAGIVVKDGATSEVARAVATLLRSAESYEAARGAALRLASDHLDIAQLEVRLLRGYRDVAIAAGRPDLI